MSKNGKDIEKKATEVQATELEEGELSDDELENVAGGISWEMSKSLFDEKWKYKNEKK